MDPEEGAASSGFVAVTVSPMPQEGDSQEWVMLELEQGSKPAADGKHEDKRRTHIPADAQNPAPRDEEQSSQAAPSSPVLSQMAMPGTWLLGHRRLPGMLGQMPSVVMGRPQMEQVGGGKVCCLEVSLWRKVSKTSRLKTTTLVS